MSMCRPCCGLEYRIGCYDWQRRRNLRPAIMEELREVLGRQKFRRRIRTLRTSVTELMEAILSLVDVVPDVPIEPTIKRDPDDDKFLACALAAQADCIISGDSHLLSLKRYKDIPIVVPGHFLRAWDKSK